MNGDELMKFARRGRAAQDAIDAVIARLPTVGDELRRACPKDKARVVNKDAQRKADSQREVTFRAQVWRNSKYVCAFCGRKVERTLALTASQGHVDHIKPRSTSPALKFDPKNGRILCASCHAKRHGRPG